MNYEYHQTDLSRGVLGGLFAGLIACVINLAFVFAYRTITAFYDFNGMDITVISFASILLSIACGIVFYWFIHFMKKGMTLYRIAVIIVTMLIAIAGISLRRSVMGDAPNEFIVMVIVTQAVIGFLAAFLIPYLSKHDSIIS